VAVIVNADNVFPEEISMGLTIHYSLRTHLTRLHAIRILVESLRQIARDLPFKEVGELLEFKGKDADFEHGSRQDENRWFKIQAGNHLEQGHTHYRVKPVHVIGFSTWPGNGCERANFGFSLYPALIDVAGPQGKKRRLATALDGWQWRLFCKTQYACAPASGGVQNFLRCHLCVVKLLDFASGTDLLTVEVQDEGKYWENRNLAKLAREVGEWNEFIAAYAGMLKDKADQEGVVPESAITGFANFEHLEARGREQLLKRLERVHCRVRGHAQGQGGPGRGRPGIRDHRPCQLRTPGGQGSRTLAQAAERAPLIKIILSPFLPRAAPQADLFSRGYFLNLTASVS
jgi:hypothetical protein